MEGLFQPVGTFYFSGALPVTDLRACAADRRGCESDVAVCSRFDHQVIEFLFWQWDCPSCITTVCHKPRRFGDVCGGARSQRQK